MILSHPSHSLSFRDPWKYCRADIKASKYEVVAVAQVRK